MYIPTTFGYFVQTLELHNVFGCFGLELHNVFGCFGGFLLCFLVPSFIFIRKRCFNWGGGVWMEFDTFRF